MTLLFSLSIQMIKKLFKFNEKITGIEICYYPSKLKILRVYDIFEYMQINNWCSFHCSTLHILAGLVVKYKQTVIL